MGMNRRIDILIVSGCINNSCKIISLPKKYFINSWNKIDIELGHAMSQIKICPEEKYNN